MEDFLKKYYDFIERHIRVLIITGNKKFKFKKSKFGDDSYEVLTHSTTFSGDTHIFEYECRGEKFIPAYAEKAIESLFKDFPILVLEGESHTYDAMIIRNKDIFNKGFTTNDIDLVRNFLIDQCNIDLINYKRNSHLIEGDNFDSDFLKREYISKMEYAFLEELKDLDRSIKRTSESILKYEESLKKDEEKREAILSKLTDEQKLLYEVSDD